MEYHHESLLADGLALNAFKLANAIRYAKAKGMGWLLVGYYLSNAREVARASKANANRRLIFQCAKGSLAAITNEGT